MRHFHFFPFEFVRGSNALSITQMSCTSLCTAICAVCMAGSATMVNVRCSDYAGYTCQNSSTLISSLSICGDVLSKEAFGQHCAPSEPSILHQLEAAVVMPNYNRLMPSARSLISIIDNGYCSAAEKRLAWWVCIFSYALFLLNGLKNFS